MVMLHKNNYPEEKGFDIDWLIIFISSFSGKAQQM